MLYNSTAPRNKNSDANVHHIHPLLPSKKNSAVNQFEHIVQDEIAAGAVGQELENLGVVHGAFFVVNLEEGQ